MSLCTILYTDSYSHQPVQSHYESLRCCGLETVARVGEPGILLPLELGPGALLFPVVELEALQAQAVVWYVFQVQAAGLEIFQSGRGSRPSRRTSG